MDMNKKNDKNVAIKESIEIVKKFNKENRYRDCGRINNAIDTLIYIAENSIPVQKVKDLMEKLNKEIKNYDEIEAIFKIKQQQILQDLLEDK